MQRSIIKLTKKLVSIPSVSPFDKGCQSILIKRLKKIGFSIEIMNKKNTNNFWAYSGKGKTLTFLGHTDVVHSGNEKNWETPPFNPVVKNNQLFGRGVADMKGALAAMIVAVENFFLKHSPSRRKGRISFIITSDEESLAHDGTITVVNKLISRKENINYCIIGEPTSNVFFGDTIKNGRRGSISGNLTIFGQQGHVAYPHLADNPIHKTLLFLHELTCINWDNGNKEFDKTNLQITTIQSGKKVSNIIPGEIKIMFNLRFNTESTVNSLRSRINELLNKFQLKHKIKWNLSGLPFITKNGKLINIVKKSIKKFTQICPQLSTSGGTSDGRFLALMKPEIVEFGLINKSIHKENEHSNIFHLQKLALIYENIMEQLFL